MKIIEFLSENRVISITKPDDSTFKRIKSECSKIIGVYKNSKKFLYRGEQDAQTPQIFKAWIHKDRKPVEMPIDRHNDFNKTLSSLGFDSHRGNSIFTTGSKSIAKEWGRPCVIFPTDGYKFTWFDNDSTEYIYNKIDHFYDVISEKIYKLHIKSGKEGLINRLPEARKDAASSVFNEIILEQLELIIKFAFDDQNKPLPYNDFRKIASENFIENELNPVDTNLGQAVSTSREVLFSNCEYYGVPLGMSDYHNIISKILK